MRLLFASLLTLTVFSRPVHAQTNPVDRWKKVNAFSFGDPKSKYESKLSYGSKTKNGDESYAYSSSGYGDDQSHLVFGYYYNNISLIFSAANELSGMQYSIIYRPEDYNSQLDYENISKRLKNMLGANPVKLAQFENGVSQSGLAWTGEEVKISFFTKSSTNGSLSNELLIEKKQ